MQTISEVTRPDAAPAARAHDLDSLAALDADALGRLYAAGRATSVGALEGSPQGRMLAVRALDHGTIAGAIRRVAGARAFPWGGKSFQGTGSSGAGVNRVHLFGRHQLFPFLTHVSPSV